MGFFLYSAKSRVSGVLLFMPLKLKFSLWKCFIINLSYLIKINCFEFHLFVHQFWYASSEFVYFIYTFNCNGVKSLMMYWSLIFTKLCICISLLSRLSLFCFSVSYFQVNLDKFINFIIFLKKLWFFEPFNIYFVIIY